MIRQSNVVRIENLTVASYTIPTDLPESDGTFEWDSTTIVVVMVEAGGKQGIGYTYADGATATLIYQVLSPTVVGLDALSPSAAYIAMWRAAQSWPSRHCLNRNLCR